MEPLLEGIDTPVTVGFIKRMLANLPDDKLVQFSTVCFEVGNVPLFINRCFIGGGVSDNPLSPISFDLCE